MPATLSDRPVWLERVFTGEDVDAERRGSKTLIARSECTFDCSDDATLERCIEAIRASDDNLRTRPQQNAFYDWQSPTVERRPDGGGVLTLGVAWYDQQFFDAKHEVYLSPQHAGIFERIGVTADDIAISHWKLVG